MANTKLDKQNKNVNIMLTYNFLKEGKSINEIEEFFLKNRKLKRVTIHGYLRDARKLIASEADMDVDYASALHDARYEKIWENEKNAYLEWIAVPEEPFERANNMEIIRRYSSLLKSMKQREAMFGLRDKNIIGMVHSNLTLTKDHKSTTFQEYIEQNVDLKKLNVEEKVKLLKIMESSYDGDLFKEEVYLADEEEVEVKEVAKKSNRLTSKQVEKDNSLKQMPKPKTTKKIDKRISSSTVVKDLVGDKKGNTPEKSLDKLKQSIINKIKKKYEEK